MADTNLSGQSSLHTRRHFQLTCRIIVTILVGFLKLGTLTSGAVFIYTFCANAFFLVSWQIPSAAFS